MKITVIPNGLPQKHWLIRNVTKSLKSQTSNKTFHW